MQATKLPEGKLPINSTTIRPAQLTIAEIESDEIKFPQNEPLSSDNKLRSVTSLNNLLGKSPKGSFVQPIKIDKGNNKPLKSLQEQPIPKVRRSNTTALPQIVKKRVSSDVPEDNSRTIEGINQKILSETIDNFEKGAQSDLYSTRHALFLQNLEKNAKEKRLNEELKKKQKENQLAKLRDNMGINKIQSRLVSIKKNVTQNFDGQSQIQESEDTKKSNQENLCEEPAMRKTQMRKTINVVRGSSNSNNRVTIIFNRNTVKPATTTELAGEKEERERATRPEEEKKGFERRREESIKAAVLKNNLTDLALWKKMQNIDPQAKVFLVLGGYGDLKKALRERGWVENTERRSPFFDLKWTTNECDLWEGSLDDNQLGNHYPGNGALTTKAGLCKSLKYLAIYGKVDQRVFYPRCYCMDVSGADTKTFINDFKISKAEAILKTYLNCGGKVSEQELEKTRVSFGICKRYLKEINQMHAFEVTQQEWSTISADEISPEALAAKKHTKWMNKIMKSKSKRKKKKRKTKKVAEEPESDKKEDQTPTINEATPTTNETVTLVKDEGNKDDADEPEEDSGEELADEFLVDEKFLQDVQDTLEALRAVSPQYDMNTGSNIWIVKPARLSRGRGIACYKNLVEILDRTKQGGQWVVQKYIENPLIIHKRKFDIRQWVLVTDWSPMTVWFYEECYLRFGAMEFDVKQLSRFVHLTNNSVTKHCKGGGEEEIEGNMWTCHEFEEYLKTVGPKDTNIFADRIKPNMKRIVNASLQAAQRYVEVRKNCFELYGYDFMVDENYNVWLIEVNCSPAMDYSTEVTKRLVKMVLEDTVKVVVDAKMGRRKKKVDTGLFTCIHRDHKFTYEMPTASNEKELGARSQNNNGAENGKKSD